MPPSFVPILTKTKNPDLLPSTRARIDLYRNAQTYAPQEAATIRKAGRRSRAKYLILLPLLYPLRRFSARKIACQAPSPSNTIAKQQYPRGVLVMLQVAIIEYIDQKQTPTAIAAPETNLLITSILHTTHLVVNILQTPVRRKLLNPGTLRPKYPGGGRGVPYRR